jgi:predicted nucleic acid-binding protein
VRQIVSNTGPIIHLCEAGILRLLGTTGNVRIPPAVLTEARRWGAISEELPAGVCLETLDDDHANEAARWERAGLLDAGEAEALALARQTHAEWLLTDDAAA